MRSTSVRATTVTVLLIACALVVPFFAANTPLAPNEVGSAAPSTSSSPAFSQTAAHESGALERDSAPSEGALENPAAESVPLPRTTIVNHVQPSTGRLSENDRLNALVTLRSGNVEKLLSDKVLTRGLVPPDEATREQFRALVLVLSQDYEQRRSDYSEQLSNIALSLRDKREPWRMTPPGNDIRPDAYTFVEYAGDPQPERFYLYRDTEPAVFSKNDWLRFWDVTALAALEEFIFANFR